MVSTPVQHYASFLLKRQKLNVMNDWKSVVSRFIVKSVPLAAMLSKNCRAGPPNATAIEAGKANYG